MFDGLRNWWAAEPWRVGEDGWHYVTLYRVLRRGSPNPMDPFGHTYLSGGEPKGRLAALWGAISFPHVHEIRGFEATEELVDESARHARLRCRLRFEPDWTVPPGDTLLELLAERGMSVHDLAYRTYLDVPTVRAVVSGEQPLTEGVAIELERAFGGPSAEFWLALERHHRTWLAKHMPGCVVDFATDPEIRTLAAENGIDVTRCEFCGGPLDAEHPWRRGADGACAHEACLGKAEDVGGDVSAT